MISHGYPKLIGGPVVWESVGKSMQYLGVDYFPVVWGLLAAVAEVFGSFLIILGLWYRPAVLSVVFTMLVAAVMHYGMGHGLKESSHAVELFFVYLGMLFVGPGKYSVDKH